MFTGNQKITTLFQRLAAAAAALVLAFSLSPCPAGALYVMEGRNYVQVDKPDSAKIALTRAAGPADSGAAADAGELLTEGSAKLVSQAESAGLLLPAGLDVSVSHQGQLISAHSQEESVRALLDRLDIRPSPLEMLSVSYLDGMVDILVDSQLIFYERVSRVTEHETVYRYRNDRPAWQETVVQEGSDGEYTEVYEVVYQDGQETARHLIDVVDTPAKDTIIEKGTIENFANNSDAVANIKAGVNGAGTITLENGQVLTFKEARTMTATAYTKNVGKVGSITASGTPVHVGVVAVNRKDIPLGTKLYIASNDGRYIYGFATAEDTGVGRGIIDLYMDSLSECYQFGRRSCTVYILD